MWLKTGTNFKGLFTLPQVKCTELVLNMPVEFSYGDMNEH